MGGRKSDEEEEKKSSSGARGLEMMMQRSRCNRAGKHGADRVVREGGGTGRDKGGRVLCGVSGDFFMGGGDMFSLLDGGGSCQDGGGVSRLSFHGGVLPLNGQTETHHRYAGEWGGR
eukprot:751127-Hanusia_phi.AAC.2